MSIRKGKGNSIFTTLTESVCKYAHLIPDRDPTKDFWVRDLYIRGFALKVTPAGNKTFTLNYTKGSPKCYRYHIGTYLKPWRLKAARVQAHAVKAAVAAGEPLRRKRKKKGTL